MKLNMWTLCNWLETRGLAPVANIKYGQPQIEGVRLHTPTEAEIGVGHVELLTEQDASSNGEINTILSFQHDQIFLPQVNLANAHNQVLEAFRFYNNWEKEFLFCMLDSKNLQDLLDIAHRVFERPMFIKSDSSWVYAITKGYGDDVHPDWARMQDNVLGQQLDFNAVEAVSLDPEYQTTFTNKYPVIRKSPFYGGDVLHANVWLNDRRICEIVIISDGKPFNPGDTHLMDFFAQIVRRAIQADTPLYIPYSGLSAFLASMLENDSYDILNLNSVMHTLGWQWQDELVVICVAIHASHDTPILSVLRDKFIEKFRFGCAFSHQGHVVCIANTNMAGGLSHVLQQAESLIPQKTFTWGVSYEFCGLQHFPAYYQQARFALKTAQQDEQPCYTTRQIALAMMSSQIKNLPNHKTYIHPDIRRLRDIDGAGNSHYTDTLFRYLMHGCNTTDTANDLGLHRNTLIYRVNRIRETINCNLDNIQDRKLLLLSFLFEGEWE
jgi:hypothetical protein